MTEPRFRPESNPLDLNLEVQVKVWELPGLDLQVHVQVLVKSGQTQTGLDYGQSSL